jgi:hypothetical protein
MRFGLVMIGLAVFGLYHVGVAAAEFEIQMRNASSDQGMRFDPPPLIRIAPGDTVHFVATDRRRQTFRRCRITRRASPWVSLSDQFWRVLAGIDSISGSPARV